MYVSVTERGDLRSVQVARHDVSDNVSVWVHGDSAVAFDLDELPWLIESLTRALAAAQAAPADATGVILLIQHPSLVVADGPLDAVDGL